MDLSYFETVNDDGDIGYIRPETKNREALERVILLNKPLSVIDTFIALYLAGVQWDWFDAYQAYLIELEQVTLYNQNPPIIGKDENDNDIVAEKKPLPLEPVRSETLSVEEFKVSNAELFSSYFKQQGVEIRGYQVSLTEVNQNGIASVLTGLKLAEEVGVDMYPMAFKADTASGIASIPFNSLAEFKNFALQFMDARQVFFK